MAAAIAAAKYVFVTHATTTAAVAATAAGGYAAYGQYQQGKYAERMHKANAALAAQEAEEVKKASEYEERTARIEGRKEKARHLLQFATGGVVPTIGTPLIYQAEAGAKIEKDISLQRYGYGLRYSRAKSEERLQRMMGKTKRKAARWQAGTSLLTGAYRVSSIYA